jgi:release factor glutamine methyltransferase
MKIGTHSPIRVPGTVLQALEWGKGILKQSGIENPRLDAEVLLMFCTREGREWLYANHSIALKKADWNSFLSCIQRRAKREPVAYITGSKEFRKLTFTITPDVLIPRPETEILVDVLLDKCNRLQKKKNHLRVLELGTGSGIIATSLAHEIEHATIVASDSVYQTITLARENARRYSLDKRINFFVGHFTHALQIRSEKCYFDCVVSNPPYLSENDFCNTVPEIKDYEPRSALCGGLDGLACYRDLLQDVHRVLEDGGFLLLEIGSEQSNAITDIIEKTKHYSEITVLKDLSGSDRVISARK